jgi:CSLREA domain-containing protein
VRRAAVIVSTAWLTLGVLPVTPSHAATTFKVTRFDDPPPADCARRFCSLREAVMAANARAGEDTILLPEGSYALKIPGAGGAEEGDLDVTDSMIVRAVGGSASVLVSGFKSSDRGLEIVTGTTRLDGVEVEEGEAPEDPDGLTRGGAIRVDPGASLTMNGGRVASSLAPGVGFGGGIYNEGTLTLNGVWVSGNRTNNSGFGQGGGIYTERTGVTKIFDSTLSGNGADGGGGLAGPGHTLVVRSSFLGNSVGELGGAVFAFDGAVFDIYDSTFANSTSNRLGGAVYVQDARVSIVNSTLSQNRASDDGGGIGARDTTGATSLTLAGTIVAGNLDVNQTGSVGAFPDCYDQTGGLILSTGHNIVEDVTGCAITPAAGDQIGTAGAPVDPLLGERDFNGGPTLFFLTFALQPGSPAIDAGDPSGACQTDNRGVPRSLGGRCDIGSYELVRCRGVTVNRVGTHADDSSVDPQLQPTNGPDGFLGLDGDDTLRGGAGDDALCGGAGNDTLRGQGGVDLLAGSTGRDHLFGGTGKDNCNGGPGRDTARGCEKRRGIP